MLPNVPVHLIQRGNNRQASFYADDEYRFYLDWLTDYAQEEACQVHAYVLMTNHVHLLLMPPKADSLGRLMKRLGQRYVQYINRTYHHSVTLWEGRYRSCLAQAEAYVLSCYRYIELNPVRAGVVEHPSTIAGQATAATHKVKPMCWSHRTCFLAQASDVAARQQAYRELFRHELETGLVDEIRMATNSNYALGSEHFAREVATMLGRRSSPGKAGRPKAGQR